MLALIISFALGGYIGFMIVRIVKAFIITQKTAAKMSPYFMYPKNVTKRILILGDSSMYSAGASKPEHTVGGMFAKKYSTASIETKAFNGAKVKNLKSQLTSAKYKYYDLIVIGVGANDITQISRFSKVQQNLVTFLELASKSSKQIVLCHTGNLGNIGFFLFPLDHLFDYRSRQLSKIYSQVSLVFPKVINVIFYKPRHEDHYNKHNRKQFISRDGFHASDYANEYFFELIMKELKQKPCFISKPCGRGS